MLFAPPAIWARTDSDVRLWVPFNGNLSDDISQYANGPGTVTAGTLTGGQYVVSGTGLQNIVWGPATALGRASGEALTIEGFLTWTSSANATNPADIFIYTLNTKKFNFHIYANAGAVGFDTDGGVIFANNLVAPFSSGVKTHVAMVRAAGTGAQVWSFYIGGTRIATWTEDGSHQDITNATGSISVGKAFGATQAASIAMDNVIFTKRALYSGASFTPPTSP